MFDSTADLSASMTTEAAFNRLSIAMHDFERAIAFAEEAQKYRADLLAHEALVFAAIVSYYRLFSSNEKDENALAAKQVKLEDFKPLTCEELSLHEKCKELRNQALAHSAFKYNPTRLDRSPGGIVSRPFSLLSHAPDLTSLVVLARKLADECHHKRADYVREEASTRFHR